jgi:hypothetical protein
MTWSNSRRSAGDGVRGGGGGEVRQVGVFENRPEILCKTGARLAKGGRRLSFCHDADPCGYGLQYLLTGCRHSCIVVAPSLIPMKSGDRVKTGRSCESRLGEPRSCGTAGSGAFAAPSLTAAARRSATGHVGAKG